MSDKARVLEQAEADLKSRIQDDESVYSRDPDAGETEYLAIDTRDAIVACLARGIQALQA